MVGRGVYNLEPDFVEHCVNVGDVAVVDARIDVALSTVPFHHDVDDGGHAERHGRRIDPWPLFWHALER